MLISKKNIKYLVYYFYCSTIRIVVFFVCGYKINNFNSYKFIIMRILLLATVFI